jgi:serine phosphatase RsbU (regulator of sigma subunit)
VLTDVADLCSQALERARLSDAEHHLVTTLQESVLTPLPALAGLDIAARYLPAARHIGMGGDWYQGIVIDDHRYAVIVGDVAGHGITAVGDMAQLKAVIGALVGIGTPLGQVFSETTKLLRSGSRGVTATALIAVIDSEAETVRYAAAGHPPPLVLTAQGEVVELDGGRQPLLGVVAEAIDRTATHPFPTGSTLIVYTDGLVERRREPMDRSIDRLADALRSVDGSASDDIASHVLVHSMVTDEPDDDVALIVVRRTA